jgi:hypothetical protein
VRPGGRAAGRACPRTRAVCGGTLGGLGGAQGHSQSPYLSSVTGASTDRGMWSRSRSTSSARSAIVSMIAPSCCARTSASSRTIAFLATQAKPRARVVLTSTPSLAPRERPLEGERGYERGDRSRDDFKYLVLDRCAVPMEHRRERPRCLHGQRTNRRLGQPETTPSRQPDGGCLVARFGG